LVLKPFMLRAPIIALRYTFAASSGAHSLISQFFLLLAFEG
jgi:hypothetical protein